MAVKKLMGFVALCKYPGHNAYVFYSDEFHIEHWSDLETEGANKVKDQWAKISPHPPPDVIDYLPGALQYVPVEKTEGR